MIGNLCGREMSSTFGVLHPPKHDNDERKTKYSQRKTKYSDLEKQHNHTTGGTELNNL